MENNGNSPFLVGVVAVETHWNAEQNLGYILIHLMQSAAVGRIEPNVLGKIEFRTCRTAESTA